MRRLTGSNQFEEFIPAVHYELRGDSFCGTRRAKINGTVMSRNRTEVTCKNCLKKLKKKFQDEHFKEDLFIL
jgi:hypothetical protein